jgi:hypothetical protein
MPRIVDRSLLSRKLKIPLFLARRMWEKGGV